MSGFPTNSSLPRSRLRRYRKMDQPFTKRILKGGFLPVGRPFTPHFRSGVVRSHGFCFRSRPHRSEKPVDAFQVIEPLPLTPFTLPERRTSHTLVIWKDRRSSTFRHAKALPPGFGGGVFWFFYVCKRCSYQAPSFEESSSSCRPRPYLNFFSYSRLAPKIPFTPDIPSLKKAVFCLAVFPYVVPGSFPEPLRFKALAFRTRPEERRPSRNSLPQGMQPPPSTPQKAPTPKDVHRHPKINKLGGLRAGSRCKIRAHPSSSLLTGIVFSLVTLRLPFVSENSMQSWNFCPAPVFFFCA